MITLALKVFTYNSKIDHICFKTNHISLEIDYISFKVDHVCVWEMVYGLGYFFRNI